MSVASSAAVAAVGSLKVSGITAARAGRRAPEGGIVAMPNGWVIRIDWDRDVSALAYKCIAILRIPQENSEEADILKGTFDFDAVVAEDPMMEDLITDVIVGQLMQSIHTHIPEERW